MINGEGRRLIEICFELNADQPEVTLHNPGDPVDVQLTLLEADHEIEQRLEKYRGEVSDDALKNLGEMLQNKLRARVLAKVEELNQ
jgi:hypothetical protein